MHHGFFPGAVLDVVPGIGTFGTIRVGNGRGSQGVQIQFMPEGGTERLPGHMSFGLAIGDDRTFATEFRGSTVSSGWSKPPIALDPEVLAAARHVAEGIAASDGTYVLFNLLSAAEQGISDIEKEVGDASFRSRRASNIFAKEGAAVGSNEPVTFAADDCGRLEAEAADAVERTAPRLAMLRTLRTDLLGWSRATAATKPDIFDLIRDRDAFPPGEEDPRIPF